MFRAKFKSFDTDELSVRVYSWKIGAKGCKSESDDAAASDAVEMTFLERLHAERRKAQHSARTSANYSKSKVYDLCRTNKNRFEYFVTLTFNPELVNSYDYNEVTRKLKGYIDTLRRKCPEMAYIGVPERHKSGRYHFHFLMGNCDNIELQDSGHRTKSGDIIYNLGSYHLGFTTATKIKDHTRCSKYICKYLTKNLMSHIKNKRRYWHSNNLDFPTVEEVYIDLEYKKMLENSCDYHKRIEVSAVKGHMDIYELSSCQEPC